MKRFKKLLIWLHILRPKMIYNALPTGIMCRFYDIGGEIKVFTVVKRISFLTIIVLFHLIL